MIYIIDSSPRRVVWKEVYPEAVLLLDDEEDWPTIDRDAIVFAHAPTDFNHLISQARHPDAKPGERRIKHFRAALIDAANSDRAPLLVLYSGDWIGDRAKKWMEATNKDALPGYPLDRIDVLKRAIPQDISRFALADVVEGWRGDVARTGDINVGMERKDRYREATLGLRLLAEAWKLRSGRAVSESDAASIHGPSCADDWFLALGVNASEAGLAVSAQLVGSDSAIMDLLRAVLRSGDLEVPVERFLATQRPGNGGT